MGEAARWWLWGAMKSPLADDDHGQHVTRGLSKFDSRQPLGESSCSARTTGRRRDL